MTTGLRKKKRKIRVRKKPVTLFKNGTVLTSRQLNKLVDQINKLNGYGERNERI